jgi:biopolymer transport protein ExbB
MSNIPLYAEEGAAKEESAAAASSNSSENAAEAAEESAEGEEAAPAAGGQTFFDIVFGGSAMDITVWMLIFLTSLATIALIIDSFLSIRASKIMPVELVKAVKDALAEGDLGAAIEACEATPGPLSNILLAGFNNISEGYDIILDAVSSAASIETEKLMQRVNYLNLCGQLAPMFGLMGTVTGMVAAFGGLATASGAAKAAKLAMSISGALYTTAVGLFIAIPAILGFTFIKNNASKIILTMEALTYDLIKTLKGAEVEDGEEAAEE